MKEEQKPPKPRKNAALWQTYLWYIDLMDMQKKHMQRIDAIERGVSNMDAQIEWDTMSDLNLADNKDNLGKTLVKLGHTAGPIWDWITSVHGLKSGLFAVQLIAQIDDINNFETKYKFRRFCGYAVFDGMAEPKGYQAPWDEKFGRHYNGRLKGTLFNIAGSFLKAQTPGYVDIYYAEKARQRELHPVAICKKCNIECIVKSEKYEKFACPNNAKHAKKYTKNHIHFRAIRKMMLAFLDDLWREWRAIEKLET